MFIQSRMASSESVRTSSLSSLKRTLSWTIESGIQGRSRSSLLVPAEIQSGVTVCGGNVQLMPTLFLKLTKIWQRENGKFVDFNNPSKVWRRPARNAFEYLQVIYIATN